MPKAKTTGRHASVKIAEGSALDRLTRDKSFTVVVHEIAEAYEAQVLAKDAALRALKHAPQGNYVAAVTGGDQPIETPISFGGHGGTREPEAVKPAAPQRRFKMLDTDGVTVLDVDEAEMLRLAAEQYPSGLVPILDEYMLADENEVLREIDEQAARDTDAGDTVLRDTEHLAARSTQQDFDYADLA
jgi:hypothetical protein